MLCAPCQKLADDWLDYRPSFGASQLIQIGTPGRHTVSRGDRITETVNAQLDLVAEICARDHAGPAAEETA